MTAAGMRERGGIAGVRAMARNGGSRLAVLLLLPFLCFTLLAPGTMLASDAMGRVMVVLCGDSLPVEMALGADGSLHRADDPSRGSGHGLAGHPACGWAGHAQQALDAPGPALPQTMQPVLRFAPVAVFVPGAPSQHPWHALARGPPAPS